MNTYDVMEERDRSLRKPNAAYIEKMYNILERSLKRYLILNKDSSPKN